MIEIFLDTGLAYSGEQYHNEGSIFGGIGVIDRNTPVELQININGQTLSETVPTVFTSGQFEIVTNSGEIYLSGFELKSETGNFDLIKIDSLGYNYAGTGDRYFYRDDDNTVMWDGMTGLVGGTYTGWHVFLNGQKLVSGESYYEAGGDLFWLDSDTTVTGAVFTLPVYPISNLYSSGAYDSHGIRFNEFVSFLNGLEVDADDYLKTASIVECIETGLEPTIEFNIDTDGITVFL